MKIPDLAVICRVEPVHRVTADPPHRFEVNHQQQIHIGIYGSSDTSQLPV